jgi:hypothetical protein
MHSQGVAALVGFWAMPFAVLVSALGAIVAAAFAMFALHSWVAFKAAAVIGASLGFLLAILSLRWAGLPLSSTLETYRSAVGVRGTPNFKLALNVAVIVSLAELPAALLGWNFTRALCEAGWLFVLGSTLYLNFRFAPHSIKLDIFQIVGGIGLLLIFGSFMYAFIVAPVEAKAVSLFDLAKMIFIFNGCAAMLSAVTCYFLVAMASCFATFDELGR